MSVIWRKVWRDLWNNKFRTFLVVVSTAVGVFALGLVFGLSDVIRVRFTESHRISVAPHVVFYTRGFDQETVQAVLRDPDVADAEGEGSTPFRWKLDGETEWRDGTLTWRGDYEAQHMYLMDLLNGDWPADRTLAVERMSSEYYDLSIGTTIQVEGERRDRRVPIEGVVRHPWTPPPQIGLGNATFCTTPETYIWLTGQERGFNILKVRLEGFNTSFDEGAANEAAGQIEDRLERMGLGVGYYEVIHPEIHWAQEIMDSVMLILVVLGVLALGLSGFLIINMMNATVAQQVWQIGVMKAVGATRGRVIHIYLMKALIYGLLSLLLAVPLGALAAYLLAGWLLDMFNVPVGDFRLMPVPAAIQVAVGLVVPLLAALVPVIGGARVTVRQALNNYGLGSGFGSSLLDRLTGRVRRLPRPLALSLRNTFRRKARITLTLITLVLGGVMFIMVLSVGDSLTNTLEVLLNDLGFDVAVGFGRLHRVARLVEVSEQVPGVSRAEVWGFRGAELSLPSGEEYRVFLRGVPDGSEMFKPRIASGRALSPDDGRAILLNSKIATDEGYKVGDEIELTIEGKESTWTVVGLVVNVNNGQRDNFVPFDALARETGTVDRGGTVWMMTEEGATENQEKLIRDLRDAYDSSQMEAMDFDGTEEIRRMNQSQFDIIMSLMLVMALLAAAVGSVGLMSTMSINVVERGREIGVMRAIGASALAIAGIFVAEGVLVGVLSWLLAVPLSYPGARLFSNLVGVSIFEVPLDFSYSGTGVVLWLGAVVVLSALASLWPAMRATKVSVREALSYE